MELERRLHKVAGYHLALFLLPLLSLLYYGWWNAATLEERPDNPLSTAPMALRGDILDRHGNPLAQSREEDRFYPLRSAAGPLVGYHLRGRNQSGLEALLQTQLSPPAPPKSLWGAIALDRARQTGRATLKGPSVAISVDAGLQRAVYEKFGSRAGAVVVADAARGEILAAVSGPSFDPNEIAGEFQQLSADPRSPLIERVGSGLYPVLRSDGGALLTAEQRAGHPWFADNPFPLYPGASAALEIEGTVLVTPLMLLQIAAQGPSRDKSMIPTLVPLATLETPVVTLDGERVPSLPETSFVDGFKLITLQGPKFRDSSPFQVQLGCSDGGEGPQLAFAFVLENAGAVDAAAFGDQLLPVLQAWRKGAGRQGWVE